jgi:hypothetical protein
MLSIAEERPDSWGKAASHGLLNMHQLAYQTYKSMLIV